MQQEAVLGTAGQFEVGILIAAAVGFSFLCIITLLANFSMATISERFTRRRLDEDFKREDAKRRREEARSHEQQRRERRGTVENQSTAAAGRGRADSRRGGRTAELRAQEGTRQRGNSRT